MKKADLIFVAAVAVLAAAFLLLYNFLWSSHENLQVRITSDSELIGVYPLNENLTLPVHNTLGYNNIVIEDGKVCVQEADCANQICVQEGWKCNSGESIICLPHKLVVNIE